jgi:hypothetical protein
MRSRDELQTHVFSWAVNRKVESVRFSASGRYFYLGLFGELTVRASLVAPYRVFGPEWDVFLDQPIVGLNIHPRAETLALSFLTHAPNMAARSSTYLMRFGVVAFLNYIEAQPVKVFNTQGRDVTGEFGPQPPGGGQQQYDHTWTTDDYFRPWDMKGR